jgi:cytochrome c oxidase subunit 1
MPRRYFEPGVHFNTWEHLQPINTFISVSALILGTAQLIFLANFFYSLFWGPKADRNPWKSNTLEWTAPSPAPHGNYETPPIVYRGPYEYCVPGMDEDHLPQSAPQPSGVPVPVGH